MGGSSKFIAFCEIVEETYGNLVGDGCTFINDSGASQQAGDVNQEQKKKISHMARRCTMWNGWKWKEEKI